MNKEDVNSAIALVMNLCSGLRYMSDFDKGYFAGKAESAMERHKAEEAEGKDNEQPDS